MKGTCPKEPENCSSESGAPKYVGLCVAAKQSEHSQVRGRGRNRSKMVYVAVYEMQQPDL